MLSPSREIQINVKRLDLASNVNGTGGRIGEISHLEGRGLARSKLDPGLTKRENTGLARLSSSSALHSQASAHQRV